MPVIIVKRRGDYKYALSLSVCPSVRPYVSQPITNTFFSAPYHLRSLKDYYSTLLYEMVSDPVTQLHRLNVKVRDKGSGLYP